MKRKLRQIKAYGSTVKDRYLGTVSMIPVPTVAAKASGPGLRTAASP